MILGAADQRHSVNGLFTFDTNVNRKTITNGHGPLLRKAASKRYCNVNAPLHWYRFCPESLQESMSFVDDFVTKLLSHQ